VGAGAVVTEPLPEYCIAVGSPAKKLKDRKTTV
jgi:serine acetyltransferase